MKAISAYTESNKNILKTWLLMSGFLVIFMFLGFFLSRYFNNPFILYFFIIISLFINFISYYKSDKVALSISGAKKADFKNPNERRAIRAVENISIIAGLKKKPSVFIIQDDALNAFATGRGPKHSSIAFTTGILEALDKTELEAVTAHEISHIKNYDILVMTIVVSLVGLLSLIVDLFLKSSFYSGFRIRSSDNNTNNNMILVFIGIALTVFSLIAAYIIQFAISRKREYLADSSAVVLTRYPEGLASALEKIKNQSKTLKKQTNATAHLFISNPAVENKKKNKKNFFFLYTKYFFNTSTNTG